MINLFWKMAFIIMTINGFFYFMGGCAFSGQYSNGFNWIPASLTSAFNGTTCVASGSSINSSNQVQPKNTFAPIDSNSIITSGSTSTTKVIPNLLTFISATNFIYDLLFNIMFGYFVWLQMIGLPLAIVIAISIPLFFIQLFGLWYLLSGFLNAMGIALGFLR